MKMERLLSEWLQEFAALAEDSESFPIELTPFLGLHVQQTCVALFMNV